MARGTLSREAGYALRYGLVGFAALTGHAALAFALNQGLGLAALPANIAGFALGFLVSAGGHTLWTFRLAERRGRAVARFFLVTLAAFLTSNFVLEALRAGLGADGIALAGAVAVIPATSFLLARFLAFRDAAAS